MTKSKDFEVGYGKPPPQHRFQKGQSGNPKGRKTRKLNESEVIAKVRDESMIVTINGKVQRLIAFEARVPIRQLDVYPNRSEPVDPVSRLSCHSQVGRSGASMRIRLSAAPTPSATASSSETSASGSSSMTSWPQAISLVVQPRACARR